MRPGGGKQKGAQYERDVCVALSMWISAGRKKDLFWRSAMSGGRATVARKKGDNLAAHAGDISATDKEGHALTDHYYAECKRYADLNFGGFLTKGIGPLAKFWQVAVDEATKHDRIAMLIVREDRNDTLLMVPAQSMLKRGMTGHAFGLNPHAHIATLHKIGADLYHFDTVMLKPYQVPAKFKADEGPMLKPGELDRIISAKTSITVHPSDTFTQAVIKNPPISTLGLPPRTLDLLRKSGIVGREALARMTDAELLRMPNFGRKMLKDVRAVIPLEEVLAAPKPIERKRFTKGSKR